MRRLLSVLAVLLLAAATACSNAAGSGKQDSITIAYQPGLAFAPLLIAKQAGLLEESLPGVEVQWKQLSSGSAIRDGVVSGDVHFGALGAAPFLIGWSGGVDWKLVTALGDMNYKLMTTDDKITDLAGLRGEAKIAVPAPDSIQAITLQKAAQDQFGDREALNAQLVAMAHPEALQALVGGQVAAHFATVPFIAQEEAEGAHPVVQSYDVFGRSTGNSVFARESFAKENPETVQAVTDAVSQAVEILNDDPDRAAKLLSEESGGDLSTEEAKKQISTEDLTFTTKPSGFLDVAAFMAEAGLIERKPASASELFFDSPITEGGN